MEAALVMLVIVGSVVGRPMVGRLTHPVHHARVLAQWVLCVSIQMNKNMCMTQAST